MNVSSTHSNRNNILGAFTYTFGLLRSLCIKSFYVWIRITIENDLLYIQFYAIKVYKSDYVVHKIRKDAKMVTKYYLNHLVTLTILRDSIAENPDERSI